MNTLTTNPKHLVLKFSLTDKTELYFTVSQKDKRSFSEKTAFEYKPCSLLLYNDETSELIVDKFGQDRDLFVSFSGGKGKYRLFIDAYHAEQKLNFTDDEEVVISKKIYILIVKNNI